MHSKRRYSSSYLYTYTYKYIHSAICDFNQTVAYKYMIKQENISNRPGQYQWYDYTIVCIVKLVSTVNLWSNKSLGH